MITRERVRSLLYGFGCWVGGITMTLLMFSLIDGQWSAVIVWAVLSVTLAAGLASAFYADSRSRSAPSR